MTLGKELRSYFLVGVKASIVSVISVVTVGLIAMAIIALLSVPTIGPVLTGAAPFLMPSVLDSIWNISMFAAVIAAILAILIIAIPMYVVAWGFYGQSIFGFVKGQRGVFGYLNVGIRDLLSSAVASVFLALIGMFAPATGGIAGILGILVHLTVYGFVAVNVMGFRRS